MFFLHLYITLTSSIAEWNGACICALPRSKNIWDFVVRTRSLPLDSHSYLFLLKNEPL